MYYIKNTFIILAFVVLIFTRPVHAASTPNLSLVNGASTVNINVNSADHNAVVMMHYPNTTSSDSTNSTFTSIDIGLTDSSGNFNVSIAPNSYGLNNGMPVYVSVDGANSTQVSWPASVTTAGQSGTLTLSPRTSYLLVGQTVNIFSLNTANALTVQNNSNPSVASAYPQLNNNSVSINAQNAGSTTVSICAGTAGCNSVSISVQAPTQTITFSQAQVYLVMGNPVKVINIYGPSSGYTVSNSNRDLLTATVSDSNLSLQGLAIGQTTLSICAPGWLCGSLTVHVVSSGSDVPYQAVVQASANSNFSQKPQLTSFSISSNDVSNLFFGANSTISVSFGVNQTVSNVQAKIAGQQSSVGQGTDGTYSTSYRVTGNETLPLPVTISYTNPSGLIGQNYFWIGDSSKLPTSSTGESGASTSNTVTATGLTFTKLLSLNSTGSEVKALQQKLKSDGVYSGPITGTFGPLTETAVKKYQAKHGLSQAGVVGPSTRALLNK